MKIVLSNRISCLVVLASSTIVTVSTAFVTQQPRTPTVLLLQRQNNARNPSLSSSLSSSSLFMAKNGRGGDAAASKEEDIELVVKILMKDDDEKEDNAATNEGVAVVGDDVGAKEGETETETETEFPPKKKKKKKKTQAAPAAVVIDISKLDIRVGLITKACEHEDADKLFCEEIDIGDTVGGQRSIASGLRAYYDVDDLVGQRVLVLANLKSRKLVGFPSHGMVLCAIDEENDKVVFVEPPQNANIGDQIICRGYTDQNGEIQPASENQVAKKKMMNIVFPDLKTNSDGVATYKGVPLTTNTSSGTDDNDVCKAQNNMPNVPIS